MDRKAWPGVSSHPVLAAITTGPGAQTQEEKTHVVGGKPRLREREPRGEQQQPQTLSWKGFL